MVQTVQGFSALDAGPVLLPGGILMMLAPPVAGRLAGNLPAFVIIGAGFLVLAGSCWLLAGAGILTTFWVMAALIAFGRIGLSSSIPAQNLATMEAVPRELAAYASGTMNFIRIVGAAIGVNVLAILLESRISQHGSELLISQTADNFVSSDLRSTLAEYLAVTGLPIEGRSVIAMEYLRDALSLKAHELAFQDGHIALTLFFLGGCGRNGAAAETVVRLCLRGPRPATEQAPLAPVLQA